MRGAETFAQTGAAAVAFQRVGKFRGVCVTLFRSFAQGFSSDFDEFRRIDRAGFRTTFGNLRNVGGRYVDQRGAQLAFLTASFLIRSARGEEAKKDPAERENVRRAGDRRRVLQTRFGRPIIIGAAHRLFGEIGIVEPKRQSPIDQINVVVTPVVFAKHNVFGL